MNAAAPEGTPPRRVNKREHFGNHGTTHPCLEEALKRGAFISAIFMVLVSTFCSCPFLQSGKMVICYGWDILPFR